MPLYTTDLNYQILEPWHVGVQLFVVGFQLVMLVPVPPTCAAVLFTRLDQPWRTSPVVKG
jgi:hypothetical protein